VIPILYRRLGRGACAVKTCGERTVLLKVQATLYMHVAGAIPNTKLRRAIQIVFLPPARMLDSWAVLGIHLSAHTGRATSMGRYRCLALQVSVWSFTDSNVTAAHA